MTLRRFFILLMAVICLSAKSQGDAKKQLTPVQQMDSCAAMLERNNYIKALEMSKELMQTAKENKNARLTGFAQYYQGMALLMSGHTDDGNQLLQKAKMTGDNLGNDSIQALALNGLGIYVITGKANTYLAERYLLWSRQKAESANYISALARINCNLAGLFLLKNDSSGIHYATEALQQAQTSKTRGMMALALLQLSRYNKVYGNYALAEQNIKQCINIYRELGASASTALVVYADMLFEQKQDQRALTLLKEALYEAMTEENQTSALPGVYFCYALYYHNRQDYEQSNTYAQRCYDAAHERNLSSYDQRCLSLMSDNYERMGQTDQALIYLKRYNQVNESIAQADRQQAARDAQTLVKMEKSEREAKLQKKRYEDEVQKNVFLGLAVVLLLVAVAVLWHFFNIRSKLYKKIVQQFDEAKEREDMLRAQLLTNNENKDTTTETNEATLPDIRGNEMTATEEKAMSGKPVIKDDTANRLYTTICRLMDEERLYTDLQLSRDLLAERLGTNRTYVTQVISERTGMNFSQFVNSYRINEARRILADPEQADYPIKQLCTDLGFNSLTSFYSTFRSIVGMAPATYRKTALGLHVRTS